jgi:hypothetical protein
MSTVLIDYTPFYYASLAGTPIPAVIAGKFIQVRNGDTLYLILSPKGFAKYHANIVERFCADRGIVGNYDAKREMFTISDRKWQIIGGGRFEWDTNKKNIRLYDNSMAYGKFEATGLKEFLGKLSEFSGYTISIEE